jgi:hypothetical protein
VNGKPAIWGDGGLEQLRAEAARARRRYELHKRVVYDRPHAAPVGLRELRRAWKLAEDRLSRVEGAIRAAQNNGSYEQEALDVDAQIEAELRRNPHRADTKIARASGTPFTAVRAVRERLGLYPTRVR